MREIVDVEPSSRNEEAQTEYKIEEQALFRIKNSGVYLKKKQNHSLGCKISSSLCLQKAEVLNNIDGIS